MSRVLILFLASFLLSSCTLFTPAPKTITNQPLSTSSTPTPMPTPTPINEATPAAVAVITTSLGEITVKLFSDKAPLTVANFASLADGSKNWTDPKTRQEKTNTPLYSNTIFHRVIKDFMIQGGDPLGNGTGGPGYRFADEFDSSLTFSEPYMLAMANSGPGTNGSQFFITTAPTTWLNGKHTIFGKVTKGQEIVDKIVSVPTDASDRPLTNVVIKEIQIIK